MQDSSDPSNYDLSGKKVKNIHSICVIGSFNVT